MQIRFLKVIGVDEVTALVVSRIDSAELVHFALSLIERLKITKRKFKG